MDPYEQCSVTKDKARYKILIQNLEQFSGKWDETIKMPNIGSWSNMGALGKYPVTLAKTRIQIPYCKQIR